MPSKVLETDTTQRILLLSYKKTSSDFKFIKYIKILKKYSYERLALIMTTCL